MRFKLSLISLNLSSFLNVILIRYFDLLSTGNSNLKFSEYKILKSFDSIPLTKTFISASFKSTKSKTNVLFSLNTLLDLTNGSLLGSGYGAHRDIDISLNSSRNGLAKVLMSAAGITDSEYSNATNGDLSAWQSMNNKLAQTFGAEIKNDNYYNAKSTAITVDFAQVMNYLLGFPPNLY